MSYTLRPTSLCIKQIGETAASEIIAFWLSEIIRVVSSCWAN